MRKIPLIFEYQSEAAEPGVSTFAGRKTIFWPLDRGPIFWGAKKNNRLLGTAHGDMWVPFDWLCGRRFVPTVQHSQGAADNHFLI